MLGVVSLLDEEHTTFVRRIWADLTREFGDNGTDASSSPHVSYHVADAYDLEKTEERLVSLARSIPQVDATTTGIGLFLGAEHVVYLPVVRQPRLTVMQRAVFNEVRDHAEGQHASYRPESWVPHITLGRWAADRDVAPDAIRFLLGREAELALAFTVDNLSIIEETGEDRRVVCSHKLAP